LRGDIRLARATRAGREAAKRLAHAGHLLEQDRPGEVYAEVSGALRGYVADKMNASASGITNEDIERFLSVKGAAESDVERLMSIFRTCDGAQYAPSGSSGSDAQAARSIVQSAGELVRDLEKGALS
jgi:hypothetical protein